MGRRLIFRIEGEPYSALSPNLRLHFHERARRMAVWRLRVWGAWNNLGRPISKGPVRVSITVYRSRAVDQDNLVASCKAILDGLTGKGGRIPPEGMLPDDSPATIHSLEVRQVVGREWKGCEGTVIEVEAGEEEPASFP